jgi:hypothetical protein
MLRPRIALAALALCAASLALTACSSSPSAAAGAASGSGDIASTSQAPAAASSNVARPKDMCALLSKKEASAAFNSVIATTYKTAGNCDYSGEDDGFGLTLAPNVLAFADEVKLLELDVDKTHSIAGVGDEAAGNAKGIVFRKGSVVIDIEVNTGHDRITEAMLTAAAKTVVSHLG